MKKVPVTAVWTPPHTTKKGAVLVSKGHGAATEWASLSSIAGATGPQGPQGANATTAGVDSGRIYAASSGTVIPNATATPISFDSVSYLNGAMAYDAAGLVTGTAGVYHISGCVSITPASAVTDFQAQIRLGGSEAFVSASSGLLASDQTSIIISGDFYVGSGVEIELYCYQVSGASRSNTTGSVFTWLAAHLVSI